MKKPFHHRFHRLWLAALLVLLPALGGCAVLSVGGAGISVGGTAIRTTGKVAGGAVGATSSIVRVGGKESTAETDGP